MRKLAVFNSITLDGYFTDAHGDMSAFHRRSDPEWSAFTAENAAAGQGALLFGRKTYEQMRSFWPSEHARRQMPVVAASMDRMEKLVVSRTMTDPGWSNARVLAGDLADGVRSLKAGAGGDMLILGSGSIVAQLTTARLIDTYTIIIWPFVMGAGRTMFEGVDGIVDLKRVAERHFENGNIVVTYELPPS